LALIEVASRAVRFPVSLPGSIPFSRVPFSPRVVPGVCVGIPDL